MADEEESWPPFSNRSALPSITEYSSRGLFNLGRNAGSSSNAPEGSSSSSSKTGGKQNVPNAPEVDRIIEFTSGVNLNEKASQHNPFAVDIVAIHGLMGNLRTTWESDDGVLWLRDLLPKDLPRARVFSYGYNAEVFNTLGTARWNAYAREMLNILKTELKISNTGSEKPHRPIIFICHSMGGILAKKVGTSKLFDVKLTDSQKALVTACLSRHDSGEIADAITGLLFFATPRRGTDVADLAAMLVNIVRIAHKVNPFLPSIRRDLIQSLEANSRELTDLSSDSIQQFNNKKIASFWETEKLREFGVTDVIVKEWSALMSIPGELNRPMTGDNHTSICRFKAVDSRYKQVLDVLQTFARAATSMRDQARIAEYTKDCLASLYFAEFSKRRRKVQFIVCPIGATIFSFSQLQVRGRLTTRLLVDVRPAHPNTCRWVLSHQYFETWRSTNNHLLWIKGKPGAGKSTLLAWVYTYSKGQAQENDLALEFFFHARGAPLQKTGLGMFRCLLHQLCCADSSTLSNVTSIFAEKTDTQGKVEVKWDWHEEELKQIFTQLLVKVASRKQITVFIDALDEAGSENAKRLVEYFNALSAEIVMRKASAKICISCRHYPILTLKVSLDIHVEQENHGDIESYVHHELFKLAHISNRLIEPLECEAFSKDITRRALGVFQWAWLTRLKATPPELDEIYDNILKNIIRPENRPRTLLLFQWILFSERPLSVTELHWATACDIDKQSSISQVQDQPLNEDVIDSTRLINSLSGGLVEVERGGSIQFIHESVREYIRDTGLKFLLQECNRGYERTRTTFEVDETCIGESQARLARACIRCLRRSYILLPRSTYSMSPVEEQNWVADNAFPRQATNFVQVSRDPLNPFLQFLNYSEKFWFRHSRKAELAGIIDQHLAEQFELEKSQGSSAFQTWSRRIRLVIERLTFRRLYKNLLDIKASLDLSATVILLLDHKVCFQGLMKYPDGVTIGGLNKWKPLHHAASWGHLKLVQALILAGADQDEGTFSTAHTSIDIAAIYRHKDILKFLLEQRGKSRDQYLDRTKQKPKYNRESLEAVTNYILEWGAALALPKGDEDQEDPLKIEPYDTPLRKAVREGNSSMVEQLLDWGSHPDAQGGLCGTSISDVSEAPRDTRLQSLQALLDYGADPLHFAHCNSCCFEPEHSSGMMIEEERCKTWDDILPGQHGTPLTIVVSKGDAFEALVAHLLNHLPSYDVSQFSDYCEDTVLFAAVRGSPRAVNVLRLCIKKAHADVNSYRNWMFGEVCWNREVTGLEEHYYQTVLQAATKFGDQGYDNVAYLIKKGADVNLRVSIRSWDDSYKVREVGEDEGFWMEEEFEERLKMATSEEADQERDWASDVVWGRTALTSAAELGDDAKRIVRLLLKKGADPHLRRMGDCLTPLQIAERLPGNNEEVVQILREAMANPGSFVDEEDSAGETSSDSSDEEEDPAERMSEIDEE
ncbi:uncharacterized protein PAC_15903 [Phialocephala subalpina]|uniref:NACHT domain-containing protein n=1 Tax=Phialocephala subalpina TaxID=576137 RepID=A0A1L7XLW0_9HELO|nr:uncharacterized protein PAC_15903 [Phialocephala subalpina]